MIKFRIHGQTVIFDECEDTGRRWRCDCIYFTETYRKYSEGFCPHIAVALGNAVEKIRPSRET